MSEYFPDDEEFTFPEDERVQPERPQSGTAYAVKEQGVFGRFVGSVIDFFRNPDVRDELPEPEDGRNDDDSDDIPLKTELIHTAQPKPATVLKRPAADIDTESIWSDTSRVIKPIEPRGVTDMPNISSTSQLYGKPIFAQRSLREVKPEELWEIVEKMRENTVVMLNLEACTEADVDKIITFLSGAACFQQGEVRPNGSRSYVLTPPNAEVDSDQETPRSNFLP
ncbi:MAG: cell division protein SepF [Oscillospiraceae bacterium]|jgi:hypothetical protein|nr:cell division protein SepF [Oscillospiraceae bacterium]